MGVVLGLVALAASIVSVRSGAVVCVLASLSTATGIVVAFGTSDHQALVFYAIFVTVALTPAIVASNAFILRGMENSMKALTAHWASNGIQMAPGCSLDRIAEFERRYQVAMPAQLRAFYLSANGMSQTFDDEYDKNGFSFWPLERVIPLADFLATNKWPELPAAVGFFAFADYLHLSWAYAIRLTPGHSNCVVIIGKEPLELVSDSFEGFLNAYVTDSHQMYEGAPFDPEQR